MQKKSARDEALDIAAARRILDSYWAEVSHEAEAHPDSEYVADPMLRNSIRRSINHPQVAYRFCLPVQVLGKLTNPKLDALALQRGKSEGEGRNWDARSLASKVVAPFNRAQEDVLGTSSDPYVGNAMRTPRMIRNDPSKKDVAGWNELIDVLEEVEKHDASFSEAILKQILLEFHRRQGTLRFTFPIPSRVSLENTLHISREFLSVKSGGDRALALAGALFDVIGVRFGLFERVNRGQINASDQASGQAADLECVNAQGEVVIVVEVKDRALTLGDVDGTIKKARHRAISEIFFTAPMLSKADESAIENRFVAAFAAGQNLYRIDILELAKTVLALAGESGRTIFLRRVGEHLNVWNTQPSHRKAWQLLLESL